MRQEHTASPGAWAGHLIPTQQMLPLLERFGMQVGLDTSPEADYGLQHAQWAHALVGAPKLTPSVPRTPTGPPVPSRPISPKPR